MAKYDKEKHLQLELQNLTKEDLKTYADKESRSVNNFINIAIKEKIESMK